MMDTSETSSSSVSSIPSHLEAIALDVQSRLKDGARNLIQDRKYNLRTYNNCFLGTDAVTIITEVLQERGYQDVGRAKALQVGRDINTKFQLFVHVTDPSKHSLKDEPLFYKLKNNLPCQVKEASLRLGIRSQHGTIMNMWAAMALLEETFDIQDRVFHFRSYPHCFIGQEAVDAILKLHLAVDRAAAVALLAECNRETAFFEHVTRDHAFTDAYLFFQFIPKRERMLATPDNMLTASMASAMLDAEMGVSTYSNLSSHDFSANSSGTDDSSDNHKSGNVRRGGSLWGDGDSERSILSISSSITSMNSFKLARLLPPDINLQDIADRLERDLEVKDHRYRFMVYKQCFVAKDVVTFLVKNGFAASRSRAELIGRQLEGKLALFEHVTRRHGFRDKHYFFRFTLPKDRKQVHSKTSLQEQPFGDGIPPSSSSASLRLSPMPNQVELERGMSGISKPSIMVDFQEAESSIEDIGTAFERGMKTGDRVYRLKAYHDAFSGAQAVTFLVKKGFAETRPDAVLLARVVTEEIQLFEHVQDLDKELMDCPLTLYKMTPKEERKLPAKILESEVLLENVEEQQETDSAAAILPALPDVGEESQQRQHAPADPELLAAYETFRQGVRIKHHRYRGKIYRDTFIGSQAVDFLVNSSLTECRRGAIKLGRRIMHELKTFDHVTNKSDFADDYKFYRFQEHCIDAQGNNLSSTSSNVLQSALDRSWTGPGRGKSGPKSVRSLPSTPLLNSTSEFDGTAGDFLPLEKIALELRKHVKIKDRRHGFSIFKDVFVGSQAVDYLVGKTSWASSRQEAVQIGQTLIRQYELFHHVTKGHLFRDAELYYSFMDATEEIMVKRLESIGQDAAQPFFDSTEVLSASKLVEVARSLEKGLKPQDHRFHLRIYQNTLIGSEIVSFIVDSKLASTRSEALQLGRAVCKQFMLLYHVTMDHLLKDSGLFYRFAPPANRCKGEWFKSTHGSKLRDKMINAATERHNLSISEYWDLVVDAINTENFDFQMSSLDAPFTDFIVDSSDTEWSRRVRSFEQSVRKRASKTMSRLTIPEADAITRIQHWSSAFIRLDPRQQIHRFYNEVAQSGANPIDHRDSGSVRAITLAALRPLFRFLPINLASVFTVWRPTSFDAIRKMMMGDAVGKGLDIKGKSAKRGKLSGYVPFLQLSENKHKSKVRRLSPNHMIRVFYKPEARRARDFATAELERVLTEMLETVAEAKKILASDKPDKAMHEHALEAMLLDVTNPCITPIDDYAPSCYGIEMPERLFWEAFYIRQDCTRAPGSIYDTGRASQPAFQDMNFAALRSKPYDGAPTAVIFQNADSDDPMNPFELLMAYQENGRVLPVVSDFDCFLVGTRRVHYTDPLPEDQMEVLRWCVNHIEKISENMLSDHRAGKRSKKKPWSLLWLEVLKESTFHPEVPRFGFGDPISYSIVETAVERLSTSGAVRHGAECFNYYFPQDLDDEFLFVSENIGDSQIPWKYVGVDELQDILAAKITEGFCFPLNPKWILMDPGWMQLYQDQLASPYIGIQDSMAIWFPPESGLREDIDRIYQLQRQIRKLERQSDIMEELSQSKQTEMMHFI